jgi:sterol desaturase/sphingolipid hydroxylase (fatty acid hydroxylase superfamily)
METKQAILDLVLNVLNSPIVITTLALGLVAGLNWLWGKKPEWKKYEGTIFAAIAEAEKMISNDAKNTAAHRLDHALQYVLRVRRQQTGKAASSKVEAELTEGIQILHNSKGK